MLLNIGKIAKVFWHETRYVHGSLYLLAAYYLYKKNIDTPDKFDRLVYDKRKGFLD